MSSLVLNSHFQQYLVGITGIISKVQLKSSFGKFFKLFLVFLLCGYAALTKGPQ